MIKELKVVRSNVLHAVGYDPATLTLELVFNHGGIYFYEGVPANIYDGLLAADSKGRFLHEKIFGNYQHSVLTTEPGTGPWRSPSEPERLVEEPPHEETFDPEFGAPPETGNEPR